MSCAVCSRAIFQSAIDRPEHARQTVCVRVWKWNRIGTLSRRRPKPRPTPTCIVVIARQTSHRSWSIDYPPVGGRAALHFRPALLGWRRLGRNYDVTIKDLDFGTAPQGDISYMPKSKMISTNVFVPRDMATSCASNGNRTCLSIIPYMA